MYDAGKHQPNVTSENVSFNVFSRDFEVDRWRVGAMASDGVECFLTRAPNCRDGIFGGKVFRLQKALLQID